MTPKEKADELIEKYSQYVSGYVGSSMLTNTEYPEMITKNAKNCALICVDEMIEGYSGSKLFTESDISKFWKKVKKQLEKL